tara:strand:- start:37 stop:648 length:612 start_codon:yes stop_codon:yes gene_type:complete
MNIFKTKVKDFIYCKKRGLSKDKCNLIIKEFENNKEKWNLGEPIDPKTRVSTEIELDASRENQYNDIFLKELGSALYEYKKQYPFLDEIFQWRICDRYKIQRYLPNEGYFGLHCENDGTPIKGLTPSTNFYVTKRMLVWMIYLNDVTDDGYTEFPTQNKLIQPKTGDIIIWPAFWTHPHRGIVSKTQRKYIMTGWYSHFEVVK